MSKRYQDAATQLGHDRAAVRLAGVYAIARLADDWPENRQMCVDLLCAYLRMPYKSTAENDDEHVVRSTVFAVIRDHARDPSSPASWCKLNFDFSGGTYDDVTLSNCHFQGRVSFTDATFTGFNRRTEGRNYGWISFNNSVFEKGASFFQARFHDCIARFDDARFTAGYVDFGGTSFEHDKASHRSLGNIWFDQATVDGSKVVFRDVVLSGSTEMRFNDIRLKAGSLNLSDVELSVQDPNDPLPRIIICPAHQAPDVLSLPPQSDRIQLEARDEVSETPDVAG